MKRSFVRLPYLGSAVLALLAPSQGAQAMESLDDDSLSGVSGQSGLTVYVTNANAVSASSLSWDIDPGNASAAGSLVLSGLQTNGIGNDGTGIGSGGSSSSGAFIDTSTFDIGSNGSVPAIGVTSNWTRQRASVGSVYLRNASGAATPSNFGALAIDTSGSFVFANDSGFLNSSPTYSSSHLLHLTVGSPQLGVPSVSSAGQIYYRQGAVGQPELVFDKVYLDAGFTPGTGGIVGTCIQSSTCGLYPPGTFPTGSSGILISTPHLDFNASFKLRERLTPTVAANGSSISPVGFTTAGGDSIGDLLTLGFGAGAAVNGSAAPSGGFDNAELLIGAGGMWTAPTGTQTYNPDLPSGRSQGLYFAFHGNYDSNYNWTIGSGDGAALAQFGRWTGIPGATYTLNAPNITMDVINSGQEPGGLCWGAAVYGGSGACSAGSFSRFNGQTTNGQLLNIAMPSNSTAFALAVRDLSLQAYSTKTTLLQDLNGDGQYSGSSTINGISVSEVQNLNWALGYTLGAVDGNVYLYPQNGSGGNGITADILLMSQSFGKASSNTLLNNTNFFLGDTDSHLGGGSGQNLGMGLFQANFLLAASQMNLNLTNAGIELKSPSARVAMNGMLGLGTIPSMTDCSSAPVSGTSCQINLAYIDTNLEFTALDLVIAPKKRNGMSYLSFDGSLTLGALPSSSSGGFGSGTGSYIAFGEPSSGGERGASIKLNNITGSGNITNSSLAFIPASDTVDTATATGSADGYSKLQMAAGLTLTQPLQIGSVTLQGGGPSPGAPLSLGTVVMSAGSQIYGSVAIKRQ